MSKYSEEDIQEIQETFTLFDTRGDNKIAASQLGDVLRALHQNPTEQEIRKCGYSQNPDARISFETFFPILQTISKNRILPSMEDFTEGFRVFDKEQNGTISSAELRHILTSLVCVDDQMLSGSLKFILTYGSCNLALYNGASTASCLWQRFCEKLTEDEVDQLLVGQEDSQGNIQYEDFIKLVMNG